jgi:hypothetical protein
MFGKGLGILRRMRAGERLKPFADGLTGGDPALLELLDLGLLRQEAKAADVAAGRIGVRNRPGKRLEAAVVWRELARRSGDAATLRKAAAAAESAAAGYEAARRHDGWARARCEQAMCALLGAELFGDTGLDAAAEVALREARAAVRTGPAGPIADLGLALIAARREGCGRAEAARAAAAAFASPIAALELLARRGAAPRALAAEGRLIRADLACAWGARLADGELLNAALADAAAAAAAVDPAYEPLVWARAESLRGQALTLTGALQADVDLVAAGAAAIAAALDQISRDHSPLDWARIQMALGRALQALGDLSAAPRAYDQAVTCYDRAGLVLNALSASPLRGLAAGARALCLVRQAELTGDLAVLDVAEAAMKTELARLPARRDPAGWALAQVRLARLYEARLAITGRDGGRRAAALTALEAAHEVLAEQGLAVFAEEAQQAARRLRADFSQPSRQAPGAG